MDLSEAHMPSHFSGIVRLFPLPNLVLFPGIVQALHIFEPRYRKLTRDALAADQLMALCLYNERSVVGEATGDPPPIFKTICVGKVIAHKELDDGGFNLLVIGVKRAKILRELSVEQPYRMAEVQIMDDEVTVAPADMRRLKNRLIEASKSDNLFSKIAKNEDLKKILGEDASLGLLVDLISFSAELAPTDRQTILEQSDVAKRCEQLIQMLRVRSQNGSSQSPTFPPDFSAN